MTCRLRHRWSSWAFEVFEDPWNGGYQIIRDRVWRMCRRCGHEQQAAAAVSYQLLGVPRPNAFRRTP